MTISIEESAFFVTLEELFDESQPASPGKREAAPRWQPQLQDVAAA